MFQLNVKYMLISFSNNMVWPELADKNVVMKNTFHKADFFIF